MTFTVIGAVLDIDEQWARKLAERYHVGQSFPAIFLLDREGNVRFYSDGTPDDFGRIEAAIAALDSE